MWQMDVLLGVMAALAVALALLILQYALYKLILSSYGVPSEKRSEAMSEKGSIGGR